MTTQLRLTTLLDTTDASAVADYERAFFRGFETATHNRLVRWLWEWDIGAERLRTRIPYADQKIWLVRNARGEITDGVAVNVAMNAFQAGAYGFTLPDDLAGGENRRALCEFLTFFAIGDHALADKRVLWRELFDDLRTMGFTTALGTGSPKIFPIHRWMGAELITQTQIEGEQRNFLRFDLTKTRR